MTSSASWDGLQVTIRRFADTLDDSSYETGAIKNLLWSLDSFASGLLDFFEQGFGTGAIRLEASPEEPLEYVQHLIVDNAARDLDVILNAYLQRLPLTKSFGESTTQGLQDHLRKTDSLARAALAPASAGQLATNFQYPAPDSPTFVLTYYNQSTQVRLIPYYPVVLIGVPFSSINWELDLCAIPHELGHVVYRTSQFAVGNAAEGEVTSRVLETRVFRGTNYPPQPNGLAVDPDWYEPWLEEMFADIYGCVVAGPFITRHFINLSRAWKTSSLAANPGAYPSPLVRPYVYIKTLQALNQRFPELNLSGVIADFSSAWDGFVAAHNANVQLPNGDEQPASFVAGMIEEAVQDILPAIVPLQVDGLSNLAGISPWPDRATWGATVGDERPAIAMISEPPPLGEQLPAQLDAAHARMLIEGLLPNGAARLIPASEWREMLNFGGWLDKGPEGGKAH